MKIAVFGGSFNPLHIGHATVAETLVKEYGYDKVLFVPTFIAPHKEIAGCISAEHRLGMIKAFCAADGNGAFEAEDCEIKRGGVSYTCDTLEYLKTKFEKVLDGKFALVMGEEIASEFYKWKNPDKIASLADFIIFPRAEVVTARAENLSDEKIKNIPSNSYEGDFKKKFTLEEFGYPCKIADFPEIPVSSTEIRFRAAAGKSFRYLVPVSVFEYIEREKLYIN